jgi:hypothetical protein
VDRQAARVTRWKLTTAPAAWCAAIALLAETTGAAGARPPRWPVPPRWWMGEATCIVVAESSGRVHITGGKWQFERRTWRWVGGTGEPGDASEPEQDFRAYVLWSRVGWSAWSTAAGCGLA